MNNSRQLYRSREDRVFAGVAGGTAEYFGVDPVIARLLWVVLSLALGVGVLAYIIAAVIVPLAPSGICDTASGGSADANTTTGAGTSTRAAATPPVFTERARRSHQANRMLCGLVLTGLGIFFLARDVFHWLRLGPFLWPVLLVFGGFLLITRGSRGQG